MDTTTAAYLAGIIDGEGSIGIYIAHGGHGYGSHMLQVTVGMTDAEPVELIARLTGAATHISHGRHNSKPRLVVACRAERARLFLLEIVPYMLVKREHALIGIEFQTTKGDFVRTGRVGVPRGRARMSEAEWQRRESYRLRIAAINSGRLGVDQNRRAVAETEWSGRLPGRKRQSDLGGNVESMAETAMPAGAASE